ncbi:methylmalonyl-CoA epimerase [Meiothermus hypogaeus]|uniref:Methylmalonyl-CoA epimerase n=2 Tax=Meiothermus hypogaeus TaxID=884155 RepID=A0A511QYD3_9DEIN|nr:methylmalonyl-CoA epimerase [Meiothermus hypogaeus]RIH77426.1 methylmalonyl-CoA epimerase [Meiothermus hypogaeus]GEM82368.1 methylmalonyl-CoA epimerase [Meiothermus hypogaeus NBRC 106114]GIW37252.1 MAG: methylmalonyl-CoA epimerase [Meiothermus sp.]
MNIHHIGIAVQDLEQAARPYFELGYTLEAQGTVESQGVEVWMLKSGHSRLELLKATRPDSAIARFIEKRGPGLHHIALATPDIAAELQRLAAIGTPLIDAAPRSGFAGHQVAFIHPKWSGGVLVELVEVHA